MIGRDRELALIATFLKARGAAIAALVIEGAPGIGKTTVWQVAVEKHSQDRRVLRARPAEADAKLSFSGLADLLGGAAPEILDSLVPPRRAALAAALRLVKTDSRPAAHDELALQLAVVDALRLLARPAPLFIAIDDEQWLDRQTAALLEFALRRLAGDDVVVLVARRAQTRAMINLERVVAGPQLERLELGPLSLNEISQLVRARLGVQLSRPELIRIHEASGGVPFYALELGRMMVEQPAQPSVVLSLPRRLRDVVGDRISRLAPATRTTLAALAAAPGHDVPFLTAALGRAVGQDLTAAVDEGVVEVVDGTPRFVHPLWSSAAYSCIPLSERRSLHRRLGAVARDPEERARHLALAADGPDESVAAALDEAVKLSETRGAPGAAAELAEMAASLTPYADESSRWRRLLDAARYHVATLQLKRAQQLIDRVMGGHPPPAVLAEAILLRLRTEGDTDRWTADAQRVMAMPDVPLAVRLKAARLLNEALFARGNMEQFAANAVLQLDMAQELGDVNGRADTVRDVLIAEAGLGREIDRRATRWAIELADADLSLPAYDHPSLWLGMRRMWNDDLAGARALMNSVEAYRTRRSEDYSASGLMLHFIELECRAGNLALALSLGKECVELGRQGEHSADLGACLYGGALAEAHGGDPQIASQMATEGLDMARASSDTVFEAQNLYVLGLAAMAAGDAAAAFEHLDALDRAHAGPLEGGLTGGIGLVRFQPDLVESAVACSRTDRATEVLEVFASRAQAQKHAWGIAAALRCRGLLLADSGDTVAALGMLERSVALHEALGQPFELARTLRVQGTVLRRLKKAGARGALERSRDLFLSMGAQAWAATVEHELRRIGGRRGSGNELSETEALVAQLVAQGKSNKEVAAALFLSVKTVEANLSRAYAKLGIGSRTELANRFLSRTA